MQPDFSWCLQDLAVGDTVRFRFGNEAFSSLPLAHIHHDYCTVLVLPYPGPSYPLLSGCPARKRQVKLDLGKSEFRSVDVSECAGPCEHDAVQLCSVSLEP